MENRKQDIIKLVNKAKDEIENIKKSSVEDKNAIDEIKNLINKLNDIKTTLEPKQKILKERIVNLNSIIKDLSDIRSDIILSKQEEMFNVIEKNLLDGMSLKNVANTEKLMLITFNDENVGSIEVLEENKPDIKIKVTVYNSTDEFPIQETLKMYSIISFINNKFNYKQE